MKERPILMSGHMVRAILEGRKKRTRRVVKCDHLAQPFHEGGWLHRQGYSGGVPSVYFYYSPTDQETRSIKCPYGTIGDRLWVRETWRPKTHNFPTVWPFEYRATAESSGAPADGPWKPSIHMPRAACRLVLEITDVRVERLQDISEQDAIAEGVESWTEERLRSRPTHYKIYYQDTPEDPSFYSSTAKVSFETLWQSIYSPESWDQNPWVWVIEFKKL